MISFILAFILGAGIPLLVFSPSSGSFTLLFCGTALTAIFISLASVAVVFTRDRSQGIGAAILIWCYFSILYDGLLLLILFQFQEYPLEKPAIILASLNPVDLCRILLLMELDISALMGYTGAVFEKFLGSTAGEIYLLLILFLWVCLPLVIALRRFTRKDL
jgi:Cu-processing system permease protein